MIYCNFLSFFLSSASGLKIVVIQSFIYSVHNFGPNLNISLTIGWLGWLADLFFSSYTTAAAPTKYTQFCAMHNWDILCHNVMRWPLTMLLMLPLHSVPNLECFHHFLCLLPMSGHLCSLNSLVAVTYPGIFGMEFGIIYWIFWHPK